MSGDSSGKYLANLLSDKTSVRIKTENALYIRDFYLPKIVRPDQNARWVLFNSHATFSSYIHYSNNTYKLNGGTKVAFTNTNGSWDIQNDLPIGKHITLLLAPYNTIIYIYIYI